MSFGLLFAGPVAAGDKKPTPRSLAEEAQLLAGKRWVSEEQEHLPSAKKADDPKYDLTIKFEPDQGKPSGKAWVGLTGPGGSVASEYKFELIEGHVSGAPAFNSRGIKVFNIAEFNGKPNTREPLVLYYSLDGDKLTTHEPRVWLGDRIRHFKRDK